MDAPAFDLPVLRTPRLVLRPFVLADAGRVQALAGEWRVARTTSAVPHPYEDGMAEAWIGTHAANWRTTGLGTWAVCLNDGPLVGCISLMTKLEQESAELGYWVGGDYWNCGYCSEAAMAVLAFGFNVLKLGRIGAIHFAENPASGRVMQKAGMTREGTLRQAILARGERHDIVHYGMLPTDPRPFS